MCETSGMQILILSPWNSSLQIFSFVVNPRKTVFFLRRQRPGVGGFHRKSSNIAMRQFKALKSWPYTSKFTFNHLEQIETSFGRAWNVLNPKIQIWSDFRFSVFWSNFRCSYFFSQNCSQKLNKRARDLNFSLKCKAYMWALDPLWLF